MEKRVPLALFLCFLAFVVFNMTQPPPAPPKSAPLVSESEPRAGASAAPLVLAPDRVAAAEEEQVALEFGVKDTPGFYRATFSNRGARLLQLDLGSYHNSSESPLGEGSWLRLLESVETSKGRTGSLSIEAQPSAAALFPEPLDDVLWQMDVVRETSDGPPIGVDFRYSPGGGWSLEKHIRTVPGRYELAVEFALVRATESTAAPGGLGFRLTPASCVGIEFPDSFYPQPHAVAVGGKLEDLDADSEVVAPKSRTAFGPLEVPRPIQALGAHNKYFAAILRPADEATRLAITDVAYVRYQSSAPVDSGAREKGTTFDHIAAQAILTAVPPAAGEARRFDFVFYVGPKDETHFVDASPVHESVVEEDLSTFSGIGRFLTAVLRTLHDLCGNWGLAIILLTLLIRGIMFPLNRRAQTAMARYQSKMKRIQPKLDEMKKRLENDPQALRQEQAKLMQTEGAFPPLGGCLPVFLQLPIFFGLFAALRTSFDLRQAPFYGYITDLSRPDRLFQFAEPIPFINLHHFNLLPLLMVVLWIAQQKSMPQPTDDNAKRMQRIMLFMPVVMGVFLYNYAAGLSLYMMTQSTFGIIEQKVIKKFWPLDQTEKPRNPNSGCAPLARRMQEVAEKQQKRQSSQQGAQRGGKKRR